MDKVKLFQGNCLERVVKEYENKKKNKNRQINESGKATK